MIWNHPNSIGNDFGPSSMSTPVLAAFLVGRPDPAKTGPARSSGFRAVGIKRDANVIPWQRHDEDVKLGTPKAHKHKHFMEISLP